METSVVDAFRRRAVRLKSARRAIKEGGAYINNERVSTARRLADRALTAGGYCCGAVSGPSLWWKSLPRQGRPGEGTRDIACE